jgi:hypothetical protein
MCGGGAGAWETTGWKDNSSAPGAELDKWAMSRRAMEELFAPRKRRREDATRTAGGYSRLSSRGTRLSDDPEKALRVRREQREALTAAVACHLEGEAWAECRLSTKAVMPTIRDLRRACYGSVKCGWEKISSARRLAICQNRSRKTVMEQCDGIMPAVDFKAGKSASSNNLLRLDSAAALFRKEVLTSALAQGSRKRYNQLWKGFVTFGIAHGALSQIMPATKEIVHAWVMELMMLGATPSLIRSSLAAVQSRHTDHGYAQPLGERLEFKRLMKAVGSLQGTPRRQIMPLPRRLLRRLMRLKNLTPAQDRNVLVTVLGTQLCCRVGELKRLQLCDFLPNFDLAFHPRYRGSAAFRIRKRKQDQLRRGLYPRLLPGSRTSLCTISRLQQMLRSRGAEVSARCSKAVAPAAKCRHCQALFVSQRVVAGVQQRMSRQQISGAVKSSLRLLGIDSPAVSGMSMRRGGISAAIHARVPEPVLFLQSGHGAGIAARAYMVPQDPRVLFETARALRL